MKTKTEKRLNDIIVKYYLNTNKKIPNKIIKQITDVVANIIKYNIKRTLQYNIYLSKSYYLAINYYHYMTNKISFDLRGKNTSQSQFNENIVYNKYIIDDIEVNSLDDYINIDKLKIFKTFKLKENTDIKNKTFSDIYKDIDYEGLFKAPFKLEDIIPLVNYNIKSYKILNDDKAFIDLARLSKLYSECKYIWKVIEKNNVRYAIYLNNSFIEILRIVPESRYYNYIDEGRIFCPSSMVSMVFLDKIISIKNMEDISLHIKAFDRYCINNIIYNTSFLSLKKKDRNIVIHYNDIQKYFKVKRLKQLQENRENEIARKKNKIYQEKIDNMKTKPFFKNGIKFTEYTMTYEGITVDTAGTFSYKKYLNSVSIDSIQDFNTLLRKTIKTTINHCLDIKANYFLDADICFRNVMDSFSIINKTLKIGNKDLFIEKYKINGIRINKNDMDECILFALCYSTQKAYNDFLKTVSKCSLKFHKIIMNGLKCTIRQGSKRYITNLRVIRKKHRNYIIYDKKEYKIRDSNAIFDIRTSDLQEYVSMLITYTDMPLTIAFKVIEDGKKRYEEALNKSEKLLQKTIKELNVKKGKIKDKTGYIVKGISGNKYLVEEKSENDYKIWLEKGNKLDYVCIVDTTTKNQVGKDKLVSRLYALANDSMLINDIYTLKNRV